MHLSKVAVRHHYISAAPAAPCGPLLGLVHHDALAAEGHRGAGPRLAGGLDLLLSGQRGGDDVLRVPKCVEGGGQGWCE
jgi:hypothetical protein